MECEFGDGVCGAEAGTYMLKGTFLFLKLLCATFYIHWGHLLEFHPSQLFTELSCSLNCWWMEVSFKLHNLGFFLKDIGFNVAVLLTNLSEHMPHDTRLQSFLELADSVLNYFQPYLGRIEIMGSAKRIERVYFEISESSRTQWEKPQVFQNELFYQPVQDS